MAKKTSRYLPGLSLGETAPVSKGTKQPKRNGHAFHPIMNKGGAHEKSRGAQRAAPPLQGRRGPARPHASPIARSGAATARNTDPKSIERGDREPAAAALVATTSATPT